MLVCGHCRSLVHTAQLQAISEHAKSLEGEQKFLEAREQWRAALQLLPQDSRQAAWIRDKIAELEDTASAWTELRPALAMPTRSVTDSMPAFLLSFAAFIAVESMYGGFKFGIGFSLLIMIHEFGHFIDVKRRGMEADFPMFLPGLGAFVRFRLGNISREVRAGVSLAGPLAGLIAAIACVAAWYVTGDRYWGVLAQSGAWLNVLNLTPVWISDGGQAALALGKMQRAGLLIASVAMWLVTGETVLLIVAAGALFRLFTKDAPLKPSMAMTAYFVAVLVLLSAVMAISPGTGFVTQ
jgi:Zn-dependent protease